MQRWQTVLIEHGGFYKSICNILKFEALKRHVDNLILKMQLC